MPYLNRLLYLKIVLSKSFKAQSTVSENQKMKHSELTGYFTIHATKNYIKKYLTLLCG